jgi:hypothetical protein
MPAIKITKLCKNCARGWFVGQGLKRFCVVAGLAYPHPAKGTCVRTQLYTTRLPQGHPDRKPTTRAARWMRSVMLRLLHNDTK